MSEKLNHIPSENEAAMAIVEAREAAMDGGLYREDRYHNEKHQLVGPAGENNFYIRTGGGSGKSRIDGHIVHDGRAGLRHINTETRMDRYGQIEGQRITLSKREANGKWRELTNDNPYVVRMAEIAIANSVKSESNAALQRNLKVAA
jgi:hypothetical protein